MSKKRTAIPNEESTMQVFLTGSKVWVDNQGRYHRLDGPAIERHDGSKSWYVHNKFIVRVEPKNK